LLFFTNWYTKPLAIRTALETQYIAEDKLAKTRDVVSDELERKNTKEAVIAEASWEAAYQQPIFNEAGQAVEKVGHYRLKRWVGEHRQYKIDNIASEGFIEPDYVVVFSKIAPQDAKAEENNQ
jgi:hypothetical protein